MWQVLVYWVLSGLWNTGAVSYCKVSGHRRKPYEPTRSICCDGRLHNRTDGERLYCCGQDLYSPATSICCNGRLHGINPNTAKPQCCKGMSYDADIFICCDGVLKKRIFRHTACCNDKTMDITTQVCCKGKVRPSTEGRTACCGTISYNLYKDTCCNTTVNLNIVTKACCMKQAYHKSVSTCCSGHLTHRTGLECCGDKAYNQNTHACCGGNVTIKNTSTGCCCKLEGTCTLYNTDQQICCGGMVVPNDGHVACCGGTHTYDVTMQVCCGNITLGAGPSNWRCCGNTPYDRNKHICCRNRIQPKTNRNMRCCGNKAYDPDKFQCEDYFYSHVMPIKGIYCGQLIYNPDVELCCQALVVRKTYGQRTACCKKQPYDTARYVCCDGVISHIPKGIPQCCRRNAYNVLKHKCDITSGQIMSRTNKFVRFCGERMIEYDTRVSRCCNGTTYGPGSVCCQGKVAKLPGILGQGKCCGPYPYHEDKHTCCHGSLYNNLKGDKCCGTKPYNSSTHACCRGNIYPAGFTCCKGVVHPTPGVQLGKGSCCGGIGYNRRRQICCAKKVFPRTNRKMKCCGTRPYDKSRNIFICCHATLSFISSHARKVCCGKEAYDPTMETCCRGRVYMKSNARCCGRNVYDPVKEICCSNTAVYPKDKYGRECCRKVAYNSSTHVCRSGSILPKLLCHQKIYDNRTQMCCDGRNHPSTCCKDKVRRSMTKICCSDRPDRDPYRAKMFAGCCGGLALRKDYPHLKCCAGRVYEATQYRCKRNTIVAKGKLRRKMCMKEGVFVFLGELKSVGKVYHSFKILGVIKGQLNIQVNSIIKVSYKKTPRRSKIKTGQNYLVAGRLVLKDSFIMDKVFLYRPWRTKLQKKLVALVKSCHLVRAAHPSVKTHLFNAFRGV